MIWLTKLPWKEILSLGLLTSKEVKEVSQVISKTKPKKTRKPYNSVELTPSQKGMLVLHWKINEAAKYRDKKTWLNQDDFTARFNQLYGTDKSRTALMRAIKKELNKETDL